MTAMMSALVPTPIRTTRTIALDATPEEIMLSKMIDYAKRYGMARHTFHDTARKRHCTLGLLEILG